MTTQNRQDGTSAGIGTGGGTSRRNLLRMAGAGALALGIAELPRGMDVAHAAPAASITNAQDLGLTGLSEIYDAEFQFLAGMQQALAAATDQDLRTSIQIHITQTQGQIARLEQIFSLIGYPATRVTSTVAAALVADAQQLMGQTTTTAVRDAAIDSALDKVEHFEIASYRNLIIIAQQMGLAQVVFLLAQNLMQEEQTSQILEALAPRLIQQAK